jgi:arginyl-tRNA synthetase
MKHLHDIIRTKIQKLYNADFSPVISPAPKRELGEYCISIFPLAKPLGKTPNIIASEIAEVLSQNKEIFISTNAIGGYVNFFLSDTVWMETFKSLQFPEQVKPGKGPTMVVDYIGANVGKPLHIGHICTPSIGQVICNVYRHLGYNVIGDSHFGDW